MSERKATPLEFEQPLAAFAEQIETMEKQIGEGQNLELEKDLAQLRQQYDQLKKALYLNLRGIDHLALARHTQRPYTRDYLERWDANWIELHGDRQGSDDPALVGGLVQIKDQNVLVVGTQKGRTIREKQHCNFGMPQPEGYRKALRLFRHAEKFGLPIVNLIDTPGAYPGLTAEEHNQAEAIAVNLRALAGLTVPVIAVVTGEGGSGGALAIGVANRILMLEHSVYSVISPEGCASILWRSADKVAEACAAMKMTAKEIKALGVADEVVSEPLGGAHRDYELSADRLADAIVRHIKDLSKLSPAELKRDRHAKFRKLGAFIESNEPIDRTPKEEAAKA